MPRRGPRKSVKRSKTFTGCWTCRSRGVKCGEEKPVCLRCSKGSFHCEGYGIKLVWPDDYNHNPTGAQRRLFAQPEESNGPVLSEIQLDITLETLDTAVVVDQEQDGLFSVFRFSCHGAAVKSLIPQNEISRHCVEVSSPNLSILGDAQDNISSNWGAWTECSTNYSEPFEPIQSLDPPGPRRERELMHYWVMHLSDLMVSVGLADNPYRTSWVPMALQSMGGKHLFLEHSALLHAICALSAFNKYQRLDSDTLPYSIEAIEHYQLSLKYLRQASMQQQEKNLEVVLAVITALSLMEVINGNFSSWRGHLKGGRQWLRSIQRGKWNQLKKSPTYQLFLCAETIGYALPKTEAPETKHQICDSDYVHDPTFGVTSMYLQTDYVLDQYFGITKPILEAITHINHLSTSLHPPSKIELEGLAIKIQLNRPMSTSDTQEFVDSESQILMDYKMIFYHACRIHFEHTLLRTPSEELQGIVDQSLLHLQNIESHERMYGYCGILWPIFAIACESDESKSRNAFLKWFATKARLGIGSVAPTLAVVLEVWRRRDLARMNDEGSCFVRWEKVMAEMGLDLFII